MTWLTWCWLRRYGTIVAPHVEFNPRGHYDTDGFMVRQDGWDEDHFHAAEDLEKVDQK